MFNPEVLTKYNAGQKGASYVARFFDAGARKRAYALRNTLQDWWKKNVNSRIDSGKVYIVCNTGVTPADYIVVINMSDDQSIALFKLTFETQEPN